MAVAILFSVVIWVSVGRNWWDFPRRGGSETGTAVREQPARREAGAVRERAARPEAPLRVTYGAAPGLGDRIRALFRGGATEDTWRGLEEALIRSDVGPKAASDLVRRVRDSYRPPEDPAEAVAREVARVFEGDVPWAPPEGRPGIVVVVGVNGTGKTTTIGKLAHLLKREGRSVSLAASDTFRAAAGEQLEIWASRAGAHLVSQERGADPGAVAFDAVMASRARASDVLIVDTAGRLHTKQPLMEELRKVKRRVRVILPPSTLRPSRAGWWHEATSLEKRMILVAGGAGFIGSAIVERLVREGADVAVMTAHPATSRGRIRAMGATVVEGDVLDPASLDRAVQGAEAVVQSLTFPTFPVEKPRKRFTFEEFDHLGTERLVAAARTAGVRRFVFCSGSGAAPDAPKTWFRAKWFGEEAVRGSGIDHAIIRPSWVYGPRDRALNRFVTFHRWLPFVPVVGRGTQRLQPVFIDDVAEAFARATRPGAPGGTFEIGGPDLLSMNHVLEAMMEVRGKRKPLVHVPAALPKLAGLFLQVLPRPPLSPDAVDFVTGDAVAAIGQLLEAFPGLALTPLREGLATYLSPR